MELMFSEEQRAFADAAERFARERLAPHYLERAKDDRLDRDAVREMGEMGLIAPDLPESLGGMGESGVTNGIVAEAVAHADLSMSYVPLLTSLIGQIMVRHASDAVCEEWIPPAVRGEVLLALALTEPRGGSDAANLKLRADRDGDGWRLSGEKTSISLAAQADAAVIFARTGADSAGAHGITAFFVPLEQDGITRTSFDDVGTRPVGRGSIFFDDVYVPAEHRVGEENKGFVQVMQGFDYSRALIGLQCVAPARASVDESWSYVSEREAFGRPIAQFQGVTFPLAEAETQITMMRGLCYYTLGLRDAGEPHTAEAAMCKWYVPKTACEIIHQCLLTHGHLGYARDLPYHQRYADVLGLQIGDGTAQVQKLVIAREKIGRIALQYARPPTT